MIQRLLRWAVRKFLVPIDPTTDESYGLFTTASPRRGNGQSKDLIEAVQRSLFPLTDSSKKMKGFKVVVEYVDGGEHVIVAAPGSFWVNYQEYAGTHTVGFTSYNQQFEEQPK